MKRSYPKIKFTYSSVFDRLLTGYENKIFKDEQSQEVEKYIKKIQQRWGKIERSVFEILENLTKNKWREKEIKCYIVKYCKCSGFSHPLTIKLDSDIDYVIDTLIHELTHIIVDYNLKKLKKIEQKIKKQFPKEGPRIIHHIYINFIELQTLKKLFNQTFINKIIKKNLKLEGIKRAYEIILNKTNKEISELL